MGSRPDEGARCLVLGGGGLLGGAWEVGLLAGLASRGLDLVAADAIIGTSAGAVVAAQITSGIPLMDLYAQYLAVGPDQPTVGSNPRMRGTVLLAMLRSRDAEAFRRRMGRAAVRLATTTEAERRATLADHIGHATWPASRLLVTAVDADTGELAVFEAGGEVALTDAVTASCAAPGLSPPITIMAHCYIDGGMRSFTNADLAAGFGFVIVLAPIDQGGGFWPSARSHLEGLARHGAKTTLVTPDRTSRKAIGHDALDARRRARTARAGHAQAATVLDELIATWRP